MIIIEFDNYRICILLNVIIIEFNYYFMLLLFNFNLI